MKVAVDWIKQYYQTDLTAEEISNILTNTGLEVGDLEKFEQVKGGLEGLVIGEITEVSQHPNADRLQLTKVNIGSETLDIVCGAPNVAKGQKVVVATVGSTLYPTKGDSFKIKKGKIRGEVSNGMICAEDEIGLGAGHDGIMVLKSSAKVGSPASEYFNLKSDSVLEIDLTPNRADGFSHIGAARDIMAFQKTHRYITNDISWPDVSEFKVDNTNRTIKVEVIEKEACPRYSGITVSNVKVGESPMWLQNRLRSIGMKPINNIVDITNYIQQEMGQPLHAFDADKISGDKVVVKTLPNNTNFQTLDEEKRELSENDLMICNAKEGMCIAGVFGGLHSGVQNKTTSIFIESAYFNPVSIRKTARRHGLNTDASFRYERGTDPEITVYALKRAAMLVKEIAGGEISSEIVDVYPNPIQPITIVLNLDNCDRLIGNKIERELLRTILAALDIRIISEEKQNWQLELPLYRNDVRREVDVIEEILRIYGYNQIEMPDQLRSAMVLPKNRTAEKLQQVVTDMLVSVGFNEIMTNSLTKSSYFSEDQKDKVQMLNPLSTDLSVLRQSLLNSGLEVLRYNNNRKRGHLHCFEFGKVYFKGEGTYKEGRRLSLFMSAEREEHNWNVQGNKSEIYDLKLNVERVLDKMGVQADFVNPKEVKRYFESEAAFEKNGKVLVNFGLLNKKILGEFEISGPVYFAEFEWDKTVKAMGERDMPFKPVSKYPVVRRDLALLIDESIQFNDIQKAAHEVDRNLLQSVKLFDVYKGKGLEKGKKSYAVSFFFGSDKKTLKDKEVDFAIKKIYEELNSKLNAVLRQGEI